MDEFVVAHVLGWWAKALLLRHQGMLWIGSVLFELLERGFKVGLTSRECLPKELT